MMVLLTKNLPDYVIRKVGTMFIWINYMPHLLEINLILTPHSRYRMNFPKPEFASDAFNGVSLIIFFASNGIRTRVPPTHLLLAPCLFETLASLCPTHFPHTGSYDL